MERWAVRTFGLTRRFGAVAAVAGVSMAVAPGEICALLGPPGAGKTTLLRILATELRAHAGSFVLAGHRVSSWRGHRLARSAVRRHLGYFPEEPGHFLDLTPAETTGMFGQANGLHPADVRARAAVLFDWAGLTELCHRPLRQLDYSQRRRLALVQTLLHRPRVLLLDDPGRGQERPFRSQLALLLRDVAASGTAVLLAADVVDGVPLPPDLTAADRKLSLQGGRLAC